MLKKWIGEIGVSRDLLLLLFIGGLYFLSTSLSNTFVNIFLWKQTGEFIDLALYNLAIVIFQPLTFIVAGRWAKKVDRVIVLRMGVIFLSLFYIAVLVFGKDASQWLLFLGTLLGIGYGFYWLAFNVLTFEITEPETRDFFNGFMGALTSAAGVIGPISAGFLITRLQGNVGYTLIFAISFSLFAIAVLLSFFLKRRPASGKYKLRRIMAERKKNINWRLVTNSHFFQGLREGTFIFMISVLVFISTQSELSLGTFGLVNAGVGFVFYLFATKMIKKEKRKKVMLLGAIILYVVIFLIAFQPTYTRLLIYGALIGLGYPLMLVPYSSMTYDVIGKSWKAAEMRIEYIVVREQYLNVGRIVSIIIFIAAIRLFNPMDCIPILLFLLGLGHPLAALFVSKVRLHETS
ncbi:MFS transporter [Bacillus sp. FJAT-50079]|uniref:MFS transporter n=1 Tax=Bacillus sp. FJAT-50079 TaxID=2833577 RepID=UPI001BCA047B|nr:MFS transporter [Bacillus sp. FJAT-50079]MBS4209107.1 MFS transporter [Bacillus sp. FJAT-50079]